MEISVIAAILSALFLGVNVFNTHRSLKQAKEFNEKAENRTKEAEQREHEARDRLFHAERARVFLQLRRRYHDVRKKIPPDTWKSNYHIDRETDPELWGAIADYWFITFDEWILTTRVETQPFESLWKEYYSRVVKLSLKESPAVRAVLIELFNNGSFQPYRNAFAEELSQLSPQLRPPLEAIRINLTT